MATFKEVVRKRRADGMYAVYIRVTHNRKIDYIKTDMYVHDGHLKGGEITDQIVRAKCSIRIKEFLDKLNLKDTDNWTVKQVMEFISSNDKVLFYPYCDEFVKNLRGKGKDKTAEGYEDAIKSFRKFFTDTNLAFQDIKKKDLGKWIETLMETARAKQKYPSNMKAIFDAGRDKYNDYEDNVIFIANNPFYKLEIPKCDTPHKKATDTESIRKLFSANPKGERDEIAQDVAKLMIYMVGINTIDLYDMEDWRFEGGKLRYNRHKTRTVREDKAYTEVTVRPEILDLFEKYKGKNGYLFNFKQRYSTPKGFYENVNKGLKQICNNKGIKKMTTNTLRHSWATVAKNYCKASDELIDFCLVHAPDKKLAWKYIDVDYSPIDELNNRVLDAIFNPKVDEGKKKDDSENKEDEKPVIKKKAA